MNDNNRRRLEAGQRCRQWIIDFVALILPGTLFATKTAAMTTVVNELETIAGELESALGEGFSATDVKSSARQDLIDIMEKVRRAAKAAEPDEPGTQDRYRLSRNLSNELLLARGRSFAEGGVNDGGLLEGYGAPAGWPATVAGACNVFENSMGQQDSAKGSSVGKNALFNEKMDLMMQLKRTISLMVPNFCAGNTAAIAAWKSAAHVEEPPKKADPPTP